MKGVRLTGQLVCADQDQARIVLDHLPEHVRLTRAEPGCVLFNVTPTGDPLVWDVEEHFENEAVFRAHQERGRHSRWGRMSAGIERRYSIEALSAEPAPEQLSR
jgi:quinol monooxygenase YgiN